MRTGSILFATRNIIRRIGPSSSSGYFLGDQTKSVVNSGAFVGTFTGNEQNGYVEAEASFRMMDKQGNYTGEVTRSRFWVFKDYVRVGTESELKRDDLAPGTSVQVSSGSGNQAGKEGGKEGGTGGGGLGLGFDLPTGLLLGLLALLALGAASKQKKTDNKIAGARRRRYTKRRVRK